MNRVNRKLYRMAFSAAGKIGTCKIEDTIVIAGSPRSGTTLLLEALHKIPGYKAINEPLIKTNVREKNGFHLRSFIQGEQPSSNQQAFLAEVLQGQMNLSARWLFDAETNGKCLAEHCTRNKLLVKFCRINRMLPWFAKQFNVKGIVFILRHPCAVVNSMMRFGQWDKWTWDYVQKNRIASPTVQLEHLPKAVQKVFAPVLESVSTKAEALALIWCLDHYIPLIHADNHPWILVSYEKLVLQNFEELTRITDELGVEMNDEMLRKLERPSSSVKGRIKESAEDQISKWKQQLTNRQIDDILSIVRAANLSFIYNYNAEPIYEHFDSLYRPA